MSFLDIKDPAKRDFIVADFLKSKKKVKENFISERLGDIGLQRELTKLYKPITDSQSTQAAVLTKELSALPSSLMQSIQLPNYPSIEATTDNEEPKESLVELGPIATQYLRSMASKTSTDKTFGLHDKNGKFYIGDSEVTLSGDNIIIGDDTYNGTVGLWELITSTDPDREIYTKNDLDNYENILLKTNAIIDPVTKRVKASKGEKYRYIIRPIYQEHLKPMSPSLRKVPATATLLPRTGKGVVILPSDPNTLIEMLPLRLASYNAGNTGVADEVIAICDQLLRQGVLDKESYKTMMTQINRSG